MNTCPVPFIVIALLIASEQSSKESATAPNH